MKKDPLGNSTKEVARNNPQEVKLTKLETVKSEEETCSSSEDEKSRIKINVGGGSLRKRREDGRRAVERAKANFKSHKHFFIAYIQQSYVTGSRGLQLSSGRYLLRWCWLGGIYQGQWYYIWGHLCF